VHGVNTNTHLGGNPCREAEGFNIANVITKSSFASESVGPSDKNFDFGWKHLFIHARFAAKGTDEDGAGQWEILSPRAAESWPMRWNGLTFTARQYEENNIAYERLQDSLAIFKDQNLNISSSLYQNRLDRLERELNIASSVAEQLASQVEQAKLQVNKDTPVFTVIEPVTVPTSELHQSAV